MWPSAVESRCPGASSQLESVAALPTAESTRRSEPSVVPTSLEVNVSAVPSHVDAIAAHAQELVIEASNDFGAWLDNQSSSDEETKVRVEE